MSNPLLLKTSQIQLNRLIEDWVNTGQEVQTFMSLIDSVIRTFQNGGKLIFFGNGGSAAEASHLAAEFVGKCEKDVGPMAAISLTDSNTALSAIANDWSFDEVFSRQVSALAQKNDLLIGLSTSGNSKNVLAGLATGKAMGIVTSLWTSSNYQAISPSIDFIIKAPSSRTPRAQELHLFLGHVLCEYVEAEFKTMEE